MVNQCTECGTEVADDPVHAMQARYEEAYYMYSEGGRNRMYFCANCGPLHRW